MGGVQVVTGFVPIRGHSRSPEEYAKLGEPLFRELQMNGSLKFPPAVLVQEIDTCWMYQWLRTKPQELVFTHSEGDDPKKNTAAYHIVQHQKAEWLFDVARHNPDADVYVWIDFGILHVPGITVAVIKEFLRRVQHERAIVMPGCWDRAPVYDGSPCWRFCGGLIVCPKQFVFELDTAVKAEAMRTVSETKNLSWEVNTLARVDLSGQLPIWWYKADHNETMFTAYPETGHA